MTDLKPCPFCGETPDITNPATFIDHQGTKWGSVQCCALGPEVRTGYDVSKNAPWHEDAIAAWNTRAAPMVKPLVWRSNAKAARTTDYYIMVINRKFMVIYKGETIGRFPSMKAAKAAAQDHHDT